MLRWMAQIPWALVIWFNLLLPKMSYWGGVITGIGIGLLIMQILAFFAYRKELRHGR